MNTKQRYLQHYAPLVKSFCEDVTSSVNFGDKKLPQPFLPLFGKDYERSALRVAFVGQDTRGWFNLKEFVATGQHDPVKCLEERIDEFQKYKFTNWGKSRQHFWGFVMMFLAKIYGVEDWTVMKKGRCLEILSCFAWGNGNAIEYQTSGEKKDVTNKVWTEIRKLGERFNGIDHLVKTLNPNVIVVLWKGMCMKTFFSGYQFTQTPQSGGVTHYHLPEVNIHVYHTLHPRAMNMRFKNGPNLFRDKLAAHFQQQGLISPFPKYADLKLESQSALDFLKLKAPPKSNGFDKYKCIEWVATELKKQESFMTVPALIKLLNELGHRTNNGTEFSGGRGSYRLVSATHGRLIKSKCEKQAATVAEVFIKPNHGYAYN